MFPWLCFPQIECSCLSFKALKYKETEYNWTLAKQFTKLQVLSTSKFGYVYNVHEMSYMYGGSSYTGKGAGNVIHHEQNKWNNRWLGPSGWNKVLKIALCTLKNINYTPNQTWNLFSESQGSNRVKILRNLVLPPAMMAETCYLSWVLPSKLKNI